MNEEQRRQCGDRKVGGLYLRNDPGDNLSCITLPYNVTICPCCFEGIKFSRGFKWFIPNKFFIDIDNTCSGFIKSTCVIKNSCPLKTDKKSGIMWVGERFYTPDSFTEEAYKLGISKRISAIPKGFEIGKTWVFLAHNKAGIDKISGKKVPALFFVFKPSRIEKIVTESQYKNKDEMNKLIEKGITPIFVSDDDYDHRGSAYDRIHGKSLFED